MIQLCKKYRQLILHKNQINAHLYVKHCGNLQPSWLRFSYEDMFEQCKGSDKTPLIKY